MVDINVLINGDEKPTPMQLSRVPCVNEYINYNDERIFKVEKVTQYHGNRGALIEVKDVTPQPPAEAVPMNAF